MDNNAEVRALLDHAHKASLRMIHTHARDDIIHFIMLCRKLEALGYEVTWRKHQHAVSAHKKEAPPCQQQNKRPS